MWVGPFLSKRGEYWVHKLTGAARWIQKPFSGYEDFATCVQANSDKSDPEAYCTTIMRRVEKEWLDDGTSRGGKRRWRNDQTGEVRYQDKKPGERGRGKLDEPTPTKTPIQEATERMIDIIDRGLLVGPNWQYVVAGPETTPDLGRRAIVLRQELENGPHWREFKALLAEEGRINLRIRLSDAKTWAEVDAKKIPEWLPPGRQSQDRDSIASAIAVMESFKANAEQLAFPPDPKAVNLQGLMNRYSEFDRDGPDDIPDEFHSEMTKIRDRLLAGDVDGWNENEIIQAARLAFEPQMRNFYKETGVRCGIDDTFSKNARGDVSTTTLTAILWIDHAKGVMKQFKDAGAPLPTNFDVGVDYNVTGGAWAYYSSNDDRVRLVITSESLRKMPDGYAPAPDSFHPTHGRESVLVHELGHAFHYKTNANRYRDSRKEFAYHNMGGYTETAWATRLHEEGMRDYVRRYVGDYAVSHPLELVAEVFTSAHGGKKIPPAVFDLYERWGGYADQKVLDSVDSSLPTPSDWFVEQHRTTMLKQNVTAQWYDFEREFLELNGRPELATRRGSLAQQYRQFSDHRRLQSHALGVQWDPTVDVTLDAYHRDTRDALVSRMTEVVSEKTWSEEDLAAIYEGVSSDTVAKMRDADMMHAQAGKYAFTKRVEQMVASLPESQIAAFFDDVQYHVEKRRDDDRRAKKQLDDWSPEKDAAWADELKWFHETARRFLGDKWLGGQDG